MRIFEYAGAIVSGLVGSIAKIELRAYSKFGPLWTDTNYIAIVSWNKLREAQKSTRYRVGCKKSNEQYDIVIKQYYG